jgi:hypothetical protein
VEDCSAQTAEDTDDSGNGEQTWVSFAAWFKLKIDLASNKKDFFAENYAFQTKLHASGT